MSRTEDPGEPDEIKRILERGRRTRKSTPRSVWAIAIAISAVCVIGFSFAMFTEHEPASPVASARPERDSTPRGGLATGLVIGAVIGVIVGIVVARQRRDHSSRNKP